MPRMSTVHPAPSLQPVAAAFRASDLRFLLIVLLPSLAALGIATNARHSALQTLFFWFTFVAVDALVPGAQRSPVATAQPHPALQWLVRAYVPLQVVLICVGAWAAAHAAWPAVLALAFSVGFITGAQGITLAHELGHSRSKADRAMGWLLMTSVGYSHFMVEHYRGHHPRAATWDDPASARRGESLWRFLPRTLAGSWRSAWQLEAQRLQRFGLRWSSSPLAWSVAFGAGLVAALVLAGQVKIAVFLCLQSAMAVWLLETVNYIEHYGLQRQADANGQREPFGVAHAWNADHVASNSLLANLQRHSDHHLHAWKPWPTLEALPGPQLPTGYAGCLVLAAVPQLWFGLMHSKLDALQKK